jgi:hypothetical protein
MTAVLGEEGAARQRDTLQEQRTPYAQQIEASPELTKKVLAVGIAEIGENNPRDLAQLYESLFNRGAAHGIPGLEDPKMLNSDHYDTLSPVQSALRGLPQAGQPGVLQQADERAEGSSRGQQCFRSCDHQRFGGGSNEKFLRDELASQMVGGLSWRGHQGVLHHQGCER